MQQAIDMKNIQLKDIFSLLTSESVSEGSAAAASPAAASSKPYFLFLLGTDTAFKTGPTAVEKNPQVDPFSYTAQVISQVLGEKTEVINDTQGALGPVCKAERGLSYYSESVAVVNGPETFATNVGKRVAESILLSLKAIASGKTDLHIAGHSRGAVEAVVLTHELERIKKALNDESGQTLYQILTSSPEGYISDAMSSFLSKEEKGPEGNIDLLKQKFNSLTMSPFLIDPVPGNCPIDLCLLARLDYITWKDSRFNDDTPKFAKSELLICEDERSRSFRVFIPGNMTALIVPGHHGTPMGNLFERNKSDIGSLDSNIVRKRQSIADLVIYKLLEFFNRTTDIFKEKKDIELEIVNSAHHDEIVKKYFRADSKNRTKQLIECVVKIIQYKKNEVANKGEIFTQVHRTTDYGLGTEGGNDRRCHDGKTISSKPHQTLENEFAMLLLGQHSAEFKSTISEGPAASVLKIKQLLQNLLSQLKAEPGAGKSLAVAFRDEQLFPQVLEALGNLIDTVAKSYLSVELAQEKRNEFIGYINDIFEILGNEPTEDHKNLSKQDKDKINRIKELFRNKLIEVFVARSEEIKREVQGLLSSDINESRPDFNQLVQQYLNSLPDIFEERKEAADSAASPADSAASPAASAASAAASAASAAASDAGAAASDAGAAASDVSADSAETIYLRIKAGLANSRYKNATEIFEFIKGNISGNSDKYLAVQQRIYNEQFSNLWDTDTKRVAKKLVEMGALCKKIENYKLGVSRLGGIISSTNPTPAAAAAAAAAVEEKSDSKEDGSSQDLLNSENCQNLKTLLIQKAGEILEKFIDPRSKKINEDCEKIDQLLIVLDQWDSENPLATEEEFTAKKQEFSKLVVSINEDIEEISQAINSDFNISWIVQDNEVIQKLKLDELKVSIQEKSRMLEHRFAEIQSKRYQRAAAAAAAAADAPAADAPAADAPAADAHAADAAPAPAPSLRANSIFTPKGVIVGTSSVLTIGAGVAAIVPQSAEVLAAVIGLKVVALQLIGIGILSVAFFALLAYALDRSLADSGQNSVLEAGMASAPQV